MIPHRSDSHVSISLADWGLLLVLSVLWGGSFFFNGIAVKELPTLTIVGCRVLLASMMLLAALRWCRTCTRIVPKPWSAFFTMGLLNNVFPFLLIVWGQSHIASGVAAILNAATPLFTVAAAHALTADEKLTSARALGVVVGWAGVMIMVGSDALQSLGTHVAAELACLAAALSYAVAGIFGRRFKSMGVSSMETAAGQVTASSVILVPIMLVIDRPWTLPVPSVATIFAVVGIAALSTALGYIIYFRVLSSVGATNLLLVTFLIPVSAMVLGVAVLGETFYPKHLLGMALIGCGLAAIDGRPWKMLAADDYRSHRRPAARR